MIKIIYKDAQSIVDTYGYNQDIINMVNNLVPQLIASIDNPHLVVDNQILVEQIPPPEN